MYGEEEKCIHCYGRNRERKMPLEDLRMGGRLILKFVVKKQDWREWTRVIRLKTGTSGVLL
jgi:hypothetical protein